MKQMFEQRADRLTQAGLTLLLITYFFIPISTAVANIGIFTSLFLGLLSTPIRYRLKAALKEKVFLAFLIFYGLLIISSFYGPGSIELKLHYLGKYLEIGYMPLLAAILFHSQYRDKALSVFSHAMTITLLLSFLLYFKFQFEDIFLGWAPKGDASNPSVFRLQITHNFFMAFAVFLWFYRALMAEKRLYKAFYFGLAFFGLINILAVVGGRTGYLTLLVLMLTPFIDRLNAKRALTGLVLATLVAVGSYQFVPNVQNKVQQAITEVRQWTPNQVSTTSMGLRLDFWHASYLMFKESPVFGAGIAGFEEGYKKLSVGTDRQLSVNPHNQYLLFMNQIGLVGMFAFLWLNYVVWRQSYRLHYFWGVWVRAIVLGYAAANIFNSMLLDSAEGIFFATTLAIAFSIFLPQYKTSPKDSSVK